MTCDTILKGVLFTTIYTVLPCNVPPAMEIVVKAGGMPVADEVVSKSKEIPVVENFVTANVTLDQLDSSIGFQVRICFKKT